MFKRLAGVVLGSTLILGTSVLAPLSAHAAEPYGPSSTVAPLTAVGHQMWQTNQTVYALANQGGVLYAGGSFTSVRPPGAARGSQEVGQAYLAAFDAASGNLISSWRPAVNGTVSALRVSPDGSRLYVGGSFGNIDGASGKKIAAFDITTPAAPKLLKSSQFKASANGPVTAIAATDETVWLGGNFTKMGTVGRSNVAAISAHDGSLLPFKVTLGAPTAPWYKKTFVSALSQQDGRLVVGGMFGSVNGVNLQSLAVVDGTTGARDAGFNVPSILPTSYVVASHISDGKLFISGRDDKTGSGARLEGVMALDLVTGSVLWGSDYHRCLGDTMALLAFKGALLSGTHAHDCGQIGTHPETNPRFYASVLAADVSTGQQMNYYPYTSGKGSVQGSLNNVRAFTTDGESVWAGGGWTNWNGVAQQDLVKLTNAQPSDAPKKVFATASASGSVSGVKVSFKASSDRDNRLLTYTIYKNKGATAIATFQRESAFWDTPEISYLDTSVSPGQTANYTVGVSDGGAIIKSAKTNSVTVPQAPSNYRDAVLTDQPRVYWRFDDANGSASVADASPSAVVGNVSGDITLGQQGALSTSPNGAVAFNGNGGISSAITLAPLNGFSEELWFKTSTQSGGKLIGFGNLPSGLSNNYDKHVYMSDSGQIYFGVYTGGTVTVNTTDSYNDGEWHHLVASQDADGMRLYVDGEVRASGTTTNSEGFTGYLRVGGDNLSSWPSAPSSSSFAGAIDDVALYTRSLSAGQVVAHYALR